MKIGIFSDIHGCLTELQMTLRFLEDVGVDEMVCLGDLVDKGGHSEEVVKLMIQLGIPCVQGNHDYKAQFSWFHYSEPVSEQSLNYLLNLPEVLRFDWAGVPVYLSHCNPWQDTSIYVYPTRHPALFAEIATAVEEQIIILGHTHMPMRVQVGEKWILNSGALFGNVASDSVYGERRTDQRTCAILSLPDFDFSVYDINTGQVLLL